MREPWSSSFLFAFFFILSSIAARYQHSVNLPTKWTNNESYIPSTNFTDGSSIRVVLFNRDDSADFLCGFFCNGTCTSYLFAIVINLFDYNNEKDFPEVIWSANGDYPVRHGAILNLTAAGELVLHDVDGSRVWTANTTGKSIAGMNLTEEGNLMLFDGRNSTVWQSFDHPTDCLVAGQKLFQGQKLLSSVSSTNLTAQKDSYSLQLTNEGLFASIETNGNPPQVYFYHLLIYLNSVRVRYVQFVNGSLSFVYNFNDRPAPDFVGEILNTGWAFPPESPFRYMKLMPDGQLKAFGWSYNRNNLAVADLLSGPPGECSYPLACGRNAICSVNKQCSCPRTGYFRAVNDREPNMGCFHVTPLTCNATKYQDFIEIKKIKYFTYNANMKNVNAETCKQACLNNCSCKAALFEYGNYLFSTSGDCYLLSELFTMTSTSVDELSLNASAFIREIKNIKYLGLTTTAAFIKIQNVTSFSSIQNVTSFSSSRKNSATVIGSATRSFVLLIVVVGFTTFIVQKQKRNRKTEEECIILRK